MAPTEAPKGTWPGFSQRPIDDEEPDISRSPPTRRMHDEWIEALEEDDVEALSATLSESPEAARWLDDDGMSALQLAAFAGSIGCVRELLGRGAEVDELDASGWSALALAAEQDRGECVSELLSAGASMEIAHAWGSTPPGVAMRCDARDALSRMIAAGWSPDARGRDGLPALAFAALCGSGGCFQELLAAGADFHALDGLGRSISRILAEEPSPFDPALGDDREIERRRLRAEVEARELGACVPASANPSRPKGL